MQIAFFSTVIVPSTNHCSAPSRPKAPPLTSWTWMAAGRQLLLTCSTHTTCVNEDDGETHEEGPHLSHHHPHSPQRVLAKGNCVGRAGCVYRTGQQRLLTSCHPCPTGEGWCFRTGWRRTYDK